MSKRLLAGLAFVITGLLSTGGAVSIVSAQDSATPTTDHAMVEGIALHPAHIHAGTCENIGDVVFPLTDVAAADDAMMQSATPSMAMDATPEAASMLTSSTVVDASLDDIVGGEHAINVHKSAAEIDVYIACGDVTGEVTDGMLTIDLQEQNASGFSGQAMLTDNGDGTTTVELHLMQDEMQMATPAA